MAVPKRRISKTRGRKRRTHIRARSIQVVVCKECHLSIPPHAVCPRCGHYARFSRPVVPSDD
ncbi:MAG TPA: 50S ribosomal protein L32 [Planctomycetaceae bacterium]|nr:50S ribosomal protein L32 [Planctomycetaceae bacterium]HCC99275.1 50S ribosomal protein L32 [Planctomycetaceae bacterium]